MRFLIPLFALVFLLASAGGPANAAAFRLWPDTQVVGEIRHVRTLGDENLRDIAAQFDVGLRALERLNAGIDPSAPGSGIWITLPTEFVLPDAPRQGLVINVAERRLYYYVPSLLGRGAEVMTFPVVLGERGWSAMLGAGRIAAKLKDARPSPVPAAYAPNEAAGEPRDDLQSADLALQLDIGGCLIQAIDFEPESGERDDPVCVGLSAKDLKLLYEEVREGTPVHIIEQAHKAGWRDGVLYLESHAAPRAGGARSVTPAVRAIIQATAARRLPIDWDVVRRVAEEASGVPVRVSR